MEISLRLGLITILLVTLQGCTVAYYKTDDNLNTFRENTSEKSCVINYSLAISAERRKLTTGTKEMISWANEAKAKYLASSEKVFKEQDCSANYEEDEGKASFIINVKIFPYHSALPQEWLTGLSFGLIPSWGTRQKEYTYAFTNKVESTHQLYSIDNVSFSHIVLFPVFWITFWTPDELRAFEKALENFIKIS